MRNVQSAPAVLSHTKKPRAYLSKDQKLLLESIDELFFKLVLQKSRKQTCFLYFLLTLGVEADECVQHNLYIKKFPTLEIAQSDLGHEADGLGGVSVLVKRVLGLWKEEGGGVG